MSHEQASRVGRGVGLALASLLVACTTSQEAPRPRPESADHHLHIHTPEAAAHLDLLNEVLEGGDPGAGDASVARSATDAIAALDRAGLEGGVVLSNAYMFGLPDLEVENELDKVEAENEYVATQVAQYPSRLVGLCSVNPLRAYAIGEVGRCAADPRISGLKLHLANSDVDLHDSEHVQQLAEVFRRLEELGMPVLVHMRTRNPDYGEADAAIFIDQILSEAPTITVQIAHMAGWGGYDDGTDAALGAFVQAFDDGRLERGRLTFGLGAVVFLPEAAGDDLERADQVREANLELAERIRQIGTERVVYATDWPSWPPVAEVSAGIEKNLELVRAALPLTTGELEQVLANVGEIFDSP